MRASSPRHNNRSAERRNTYVERLIRTLRRECVDRMLVFGEAHLRKILSAYAAYSRRIILKSSFQHTQPALAERGKRA